MSQEKDIVDELFDQPSNWGEVDDLTRRAGRKIQLLRGVILRLKEENRDLLSRIDRIVDYKLIIDNYEDSFRAEE